MINRMADISLRQAGIVTGVAMLIMAIAATFATDLLIGRLVVPGDAVATFTNIQNAEMVFRGGLLSWLVVLICDVLVAWGLYILLKPVNQSLSLLTAWLRLVYVAMLGTAILNLVVVLSLVSGDNYLAALGADQLQAHVLLFLNAFDSMWSVGLAVFGFHILLLGYLVYKSGYMPKWIGALLLLAFLGYFISHFVSLLIPNFENYEYIIGMIFILPMILGEVGLGVWLLIKNAKLSA
ncbi:DUF4386 domain-containing protein [bacterium]|nr:DUF4386 domain-containing protein [bacterium]